MSCIFSTSAIWLAGDVKEPTHLSKSLVQVVPVLWSVFFSRVGASHGVNFIAPFPLRHICPRKISMTMIFWLFQYTCNEAFSLAKSLFITLICIVAYRHKAFKMILAVSVFTQAKNDIFRLLKFR